MLTRKVAMSVAPSTGARLGDVAIELAKGNVAAGAAADASTGMPAKLITAETAGGGGGRAIHSRTRLLRGARRCWKFSLEP